APEQITSFRSALPPVDQYAAAATLYNLLTGRYIYDLLGDFQGQLLMILETDPVPLRSRRPELPAALEKVVQRALAREPNQRFPDVKAFRQALLPFVHG